MELARLQLAIYEGDLDDAAARIRTPPAVIRHHWRFRLVPFIWHLAAGRLALLMGELPKAEKRAQALIQLGEPVTLGAAGLLRAGIANTQGLPFEPEANEAKHRLNTQYHQLFALTLGERPLEALSEYGVANPTRAFTWLRGIPPSSATPPQNTPLI